MAKLLVVLGAIGQQGSSVVTTYLRKPEWKIRAITRDNKGSDEGGCEEAAGEGGGGCEG